MKYQHHVLWDIHSPIYWHECFLFSYQHLAVSPRKQTSLHSDLVNLIFVVVEFTGVGVFAKKNFTPGAFLLQYPGELISEEEAERRETTPRLSDVFFHRWKQDNVVIIFVLFSWAN